MHTCMHAYLYASYRSSSCIYCASILFVCPTAGLTSGCVRSSPLKHNRADQPTSNQVHCCPTKPSMFSSLSRSQCRSYLTAPMLPGPKEAGVRKQLGKRLKKERPRIQAWSSWTTPCRPSALARKRPAKLTIDDDFCARCCTQPRHHARPTAEHRKLSRGLEGADDLRGDARSGRDNASRTARGHPEWCSHAQQRQ